MSEFLTDNVLFGILLTVAAFALARWISRRSEIALFNPFLISFIIIIFVILYLKVPLAHYLKGAAYLEQILPVSILLLALPLYRQRGILRLHRLAILTGITAGVITSIVSTIVLCRLFDIDPVLLRSLIPRSITTPLGKMMVENLDGISGITMIAIIFNGLSGVLLYAPVYTLFRITHPVAQGIAMGTTAHAIGTAKALELGETIGAMSGLAIVIAGLITLAAAPLINLILQ